MKLNVRVAGWTLFGGIIGALIGFTVVGYIYPKLPIAEVHKIKGTPASFQDSFGKKVVLPQELPSDKFERTYKYAVTSDDGELLDGKAYLLRFGADHDAVIKHRTAKDKERLIIFTDFQPDAFSWDGRERERAKWLKMPGRSLP